MPDDVLPRGDRVWNRAAREFAEAGAPSPLPFGPGPVQARKARQKAQSPVFGKPETDGRWAAVFGGPKSSAAVRIQPPSGGSCRHAARPVAHPRRRPGLRRCAPARPAGA
ncbi:hypothetical protein GCM10023335_72730 [Streptomyces siamensis]|uniref:Uncharacterized protein n=1 Tax=Streptomyces siamensis TaxID=1274986 RepID=A0ABP9JHI0_9ACTN